MKAHSPQPKANSDDPDYSGVTPPSSVAVEAVPRVILFKADGTALVRPIGFVR